MSDGDISTDSDRPVFLFSQDDSSLDSLLSTYSNPRRNPYATPAPKEQQQLTNQQLYTETNQAMQHPITQWLTSDNKTPLQQPTPVNKMAKLPTIKL